MTRIKLCAPMLLSAAAFLLFAGGAHAYDLPPDHPRIFFTESTIDEIADRCKEGGSNRDFYE